MACSACEDCPRHVDNGGICEEYEYDCPYDIFEHISEESVNKQKDDLARQVENVDLYLKSLKTPYQIIKDIGSGINYNKKGLSELLELICKNKVDTVYVLSKDRLVRFGFEILQKVAELHNTQIVVLDNEDKTKEQELVEDLMQIITVFSCRLHGKRATKTKQLVKDLIEDDINESTER